MTGNNISFDAIAAMRDTCVYSNTFISFGSLYSFAKIFHITVTLGCFVVQL